MFSAFWALDIAPTLDVLVLFVSVLSNRILSLRYSTVATVVYFVGAMFAKSERSGALTTIYCAVSKEASKQSGLYYADSQVCEPSKAAENMEMAQKLWEESCELLNITWEV